MKFSKKDTSKIILVTGVSVYLYILKFIDNKYLIQKIILSIIMLFSWYVSLLANSGMNEVESSRSIKDILKLHIFYSPVMIYIFILKII